MRKVMNNRPNRSKKGAAFGLVMIIIGFVIIANQLDFIPYKLRDLLFTWQTLLIILGVFFVTSQDRFTGYILMGVGAFFLLPEMFDVPWEYRHMFWPIMFIVIGIAIIFKGTGLISRYRYTNGGLGIDFIDDVNVFGGGDRQVSSKNFRGGSIISVFGGGKYDFRQADLADEICVLEIVSIFGGASLIVPSDWNIKTEVVGIFGGFSDKRHIINPDPKKTLIIKGVAVFGGGDIKNM